MTKINEGCKFFLKEMLEAGMSKAADSLSFFLNEKVNISDIHYDIEELDQNVKLIHKTGNLNLLYSQIHGFTDGHCFLIFNEDEVKKVCETSLPDNILKDPLKFKEMSSAIMLEVDNIITASVVTEFANIFEDRMLAYIPHSENLKENEANQFLHEKISDYDHVIHINAKYISEKTSVQPELIWVFKRKFLDKAIEVCELKMGRQVEKDL